MSRRCPSKELSGVEWIDASDIVNDCRLVQSPLELECPRRGARGHGVLSASVAAATKLSTSSVRVSHAVINRQMD